MPHLDFLIERLKMYSEIELCDLLGISSEDILERFRDIIEDRADYLVGEIEELPYNEDEVDPYQEDDDVFEGD